jgi:Cu/Ag efflux protein CusF
MGPRIRRILVCGLAALLLAGAGCLGTKSAAAEYQVRGRVQRLPDPNAASRDLWLAHEAIDSWVSRDGKVEGMDPMTMPFTVNDGVSLDGIEVGDAVEVHLSVDWIAAEPVLINSVEKLPPDTKLVFREAKPPQAP